MKLVILLFGLMVKRSVGLISGKELILPDDGQPGGIEELWFKQRLDHFSNGPPTYWQQRYMVSEKPWNYYGKPQNTSIFIKIGGEGPISKGWMKTGSWVRWAWNHCALLFQLEHRFYGQSHPTPDVSVDNLKYLTSEQAIQDIKTFVEAMKKQYNLTNNKWFAFGGSYPGNLVAWSRLKLPNLIAGGVASSPPLQAVADFYKYHEVVRKNLEFYYPGCGKEITKAFKSIQNLFENGTDSEIKDLRTKFKVCSIFNHKDTIDKRVFFDSLFHIISKAIQYNDMGNAVEKISFVCSHMLNFTIKDPVDRLATYKNASSEDCLYGSYSGTIEYHKKDSWDSGTVQRDIRQWLWQTCNEFGYYQTSNSTMSLYSDTVPLEFYEQECTDVFGPSFNPKQLNSAIDRTNRNYHGMDIEVEKVVFVQGSIDPWHPQGMIKNPSPNSPLIFINGTTHTQDMGLKSPDDPPSLAKAREEIEGYLSKWMKE